MAENKKKKKRQRYVTPEQGPVMYEWMKANHDTFVAEKLPVRVVMERLEKETGILAADSRIRGTAKGLRWDDWPAKNSTTEGPKKYDRVRRLALIVRHLYAELGVEEPRDLSDLIGSRKHRRQLAEEQAAAEKAAEEKEPPPQGDLADYQMELDLQDEYDDDEYEDYDEDEDEDEDATSKKTGVK